MQCVHAIAEGVGTPEGADQFQFFSQIESQPESGSLSGISGGPAFWSDGDKFGLIGFVKEALDVDPPLGEETIYAGPRVNFIVQRASYDTFGTWVEYALSEWPKRRGALNQMVLRKG